MEVGFIEGVAPDAPTDRHADNQTKLPTQSAIEPQVFVNLDRTREDAKSTTAVDAPRDKEAK